MTDIPTISISLGELGMERDYRIYNKWLGSSEIIEGNYLYGAVLFYDTNTGKGKFVISKYDLFTKLLVAINDFDPAQIFPKLMFAAGCVIPRLLTLNWLVSTDDELRLIISAAYTTSYVTNNILCISSVIRLKASDLSVIDASERQIDITPSNGKFINMTLGKTRLKPASWFKDIRLTVDNIELYPCPDQLKATFNLTTLKGRTFVGGYNEELNGTPVWFVTDCCNYYRACAYLYASPELKGYYFGYRREQHKDSGTIRLYTVEFDKDSSTAGLKYIDIVDTSIHLDSNWNRNYPLIDCNSMIFVGKFSFQELIILTFFDKGTIVYKIPIKYIIGAETDPITAWHIDRITWNFYYDSFNYYIYFVCYDAEESFAVLGYIKLDHDSKTAKVYITNKINTGQYRPGHQKLLDTYICPEYLYLTHSYAHNNSLILTLFPVQWLHDNIVRSETFTAEKYEFDKKKTYEVLRTE
jgi:hypothetical protein